MTYVSLCSSITACSVVIRCEVEDVLKIVEVPEKEKWKTALLDVLLQDRAEMEKEARNIKRVNSHHHHYDSVYRPAAGYA